VFRLIIGIDLFSSLLLLRVERHRGKEWKLLKLEQRGKKIEYTAVFFIKTEDIMVQIA
jgi:hypothetical protein